MKIHGSQSMGCKVSNHFYHLLFYNEKESMAPLENVNTMDSSIGY